MGSSSGSRDRHPCGCDGCDDYALAPDSYCAKCHHHGCGYEVRCDE